MPESIHRGHHGPQPTETEVLRCQDVSEQATDYMEHALPVRQWLAVRFHLLICSMCRAYMDQLRKTPRLLARGHLPPPPPDVERRLLDASSRPPVEQPPPEPPV